MSLNLKLTGFYRIVVRRPDQTPRTDTGWFANLVTDAGLNRIGTGTWMDRCEVGTSNAAPSVNDTALAGPLAVTSTLVSSTYGAQGSAPYYGYRTVTYSFAAGTATGNIAEVGVGWNGGLFSRALTVDGNGNPTQITVLADEELEVSYQVRIYPPLTDTVYTATLAGVSTTCTARAAAVTSGTPYAWGLQGVAIEICTNGITSSPQVFSEAIGTITSSPGGTSGNSTGRSSAAYVNNSLERAFTANWPMANGNFTLGITAVQFHTTGFGSYQIGFNPPIMKTALDALSMGFKVTWSRP